MTAAVVAVLLRLGASAVLLPHHVEIGAPSPYTDMYTYQQLAGEVVSGAYDYDKGFYYQPFYYTVFLPLIYRIGGTGPWPTIVTQSLIGGITVWLTGMVAAMLFGRAAGIVAVVLAAFAKPLIFYTSVTLIASLQTFWVTLFAYAALRAHRSGTTMCWVMVGLVNGLAVVTRGNALLFVPLALSLLFVSRRRLQHALPVTTALFVLAATLPQLPYSALNYHAHGRWTGASTAGHAVLALGNTPEAPPGGREPQYGPGPMAYPQSWHEWMARHDDSGHEHLSVYRQVLSWLRTEPLAFLELKFRMLLLFWHQMEIPNNISLDAFSETFAQRVPVFPAFFGFMTIGGLALSGLIMTIFHRRHRTRTCFAAGIVVMYCLGTVMFYMLSRFRVPILPLLCSFSGYAVVTFTTALISQRGARSRRGRCAGMFAICCTAFATVAWGYDTYRYNFEAAMVRRVRPHGVHLRISNRVVVKDHGPLTFGGWTPVDTASVDYLEKTFILARETTLAENAVVRLAVYNAAGPAAVRIAAHPKDMPPPQTISAITVPSGLQWIDLPVLLRQLPRGYDAVTLVFDMQQLAPGTAVLIDQQRIYDRTVRRPLQDGIFGELVVELVVTTD